MKIKITVKAMEDEFTYSTLAENKLQIVCAVPADMGFEQAVRRMVIATTEEAQAELDAEEAEAAEEANREAARREEANRELANQEQEYENSQRDGFEHGKG